MKKQSVASSTAKLPDPPVFFLDASLGRQQVAEALRAAGEHVEVHDDRFQAGTKDEVWLREAGRRQWVVLTKDDRIRYHPVELNALRGAGVSVIVLPKGNLKAAEMAAIFVKAIPKIKRFLARHKPPFIVRVTPASDLSLVDIGRHTSRSGE